ncbi:MAG TPA: cytochrome c oxidase subunit II [Thermoanaerobaculia bacterium]|nr:cytochrome c oxidase subunit II [Thermoanaerobaculia bacterium]
MEQELPLFPEAASHIAPQVDALFFAWSAISIFFTALIAALILYFMTRYRRRGVDEVGLPERAPNWLEVGWSIVPLVISLAMFAWGARVFYSMYRPPRNAVEYWTVGKQWMWKFQHPDGHREINTLHIPVGQPIKLNIQSEDVIHSFFVPAFRVKQDAVPGRQTQIFFEATKPGVYHLFCTEYCGGEHSKMVGSVIALEPEQYEVWLAGGPAGRSMADSGAELFQTLACNTCHRLSENNQGAGGVVARAPRLEGLYGNQVRLADGRTLLADDEYIRESILNPAVKIVAGWQPIMPTYQGQVTEEQLAQLITYVRSLGGQEAGSPEAGGGSNTAGDVAGGQRDSDQPQTAGPAKPEGQ